MKKPAPAPPSATEFFGALFTVIQFETRLYPPNTSRIRASLFHARVNSAGATGAIHIPRSESM
jgi:hypothetical protein